MKKKAVKITKTSRGKKNGEKTVIGRKKRKTGKLVGINESVSYSCP